MSFRYDTFNSREFEVHRIVYNLIEPRSIVLDLGCATGYFGKELSKKNCELYGVEKDRKAAELAKPHYRKILISDLERLEDLQLSSKYFDYILLLDVIEHIINRRLLLQLCKKWLKKDGRLILSTPNIAHISIRLQLLFGNFTYTKNGILDESHVHFFTKERLLLFLDESGYKVEKLIPSSDFGQLPVFGRLMRKFPKYFQFKLTKLSMKLLAPQFVVICSQK